MKKILSLTLLLATFVLASCDKPANEKPEPTDVAVTSITLKETTAIKVNATETLVATILPENATNKTVTWKSSDPTTVSVDANGLIKGLQEGKATITVTTVDGNKADACEVTVSSDVVSVTEITLNRDEILLVPEETETLTATVAPETATNKSITWSSNDPTIATVDENGVVKGLKEGKTTIVVTTADGGKTDECEVSVKIPLINYVGTAFSTEPDFFNALADEAKEAYVTYSPNEHYLLGVNEGNGKSALVYNKLLTNTDLRIKLTIGGGTTTAMTVGYLTNPNDLKTYVKVADIDYNVSMPYYIINSALIPANGYLTVHYAPQEDWNNNSIKKLQVFAN